MGFHPVHRLCLPVCLSVCLLFVIPDLKVQKSFYLGKGFSIFTSELYAILTALNYICNIQLAIYNFVICVDSKSVLCALKNWNCKMRGDIFYKVKYLIHCIMYKGIGIEFCWVPSHCGLYWNEISEQFTECVQMAAIQFHMHIDRNTKKVKK